nr:hypothetical protein [Actinomadura physcomitrii]
MKITTFGRPVVPLVKMIAVGSASSPTGAVTGACAAPRSFATPSRRPIAKVGRVWWTSSSRGWSTASQ